MKLAEDLKKAVLQAAMQGKLTKQLETDSSVDELLKKIADEKAKLIAEGKIKKEKTLAEIKEEEIPFDIPENWRWGQLQNIIKGISAGGDKPKKFSKEKTKDFQIPVYANGEKNKGLFGFTDIPVISEKRTLFLTDCTMSVGTMTLLACPFANAIIASYRFNSSTSGVTPALTKTFKPSASACFFKKISFLSPANSINFLAVSESFKSLA